MSIHLFQKGEMKLKEIIKTIKLIEVLLLIIFLALIYISIISYY